MESCVLAVESKKGQNTGGSEQCELPEGCRVHPLESEVENFRYE